MSTHSNLRGLPWVTALENCIQQAAEETIPRRTSSKQPKLHTPWWNLKCQAAIARKRWLRNHARRTQTDAAWTAFKKQRAICRRTLKQERRASWRTFCSHLGKKHNWSQVCRMMNAFLGTSSSDLRGPLTVNGETFWEAAEQASILQAFYSSTFQVHSHETWPVPPDEVGAPPTTDAPFSLRELLCALETQNNSAPGLDGVNADMLRHLPDDLRLRLLQELNLCWEHGWVHPSWRRAVIVPIPKPGKFGSCPEDLRPISLTSCIGKIMERLVLRRLQWLTESRTDSPIGQVGFRRGWACEDALMWLEEGARLTLAQRQFQVLVRLDLNKAFDSIDRKLVIAGLVSHGVRGNLFHWIRNFLSNRSACVWWRGTLSDFFDSTKGIPQGSCLSPILFNLATTDLHRFSNSTCEIIQYADDIICSSRSNSLQEATEHVQHCIDGLNSWAQSWHGSFAQDKCAALIITNRRWIPAATHLFLNNFEIPFRPSIKVLGVWFDSKLTWGTHIDMLQKKGLRRVNVLRRLAGTNWGADAYYLLRLYCSFIRGLFDYGSPTYGGAAPSRLKSLDSIQSAAIRVALGVKASSPIDALQVEANIPPLELWRERGLANAWARIMNRHHLRQLFQSRQATRWQRGGSWLRHQPPASSRAIGIWNLWHLGMFGSATLPPLPPWSEPLLTCFPHLPNSLQTCVPSSTIHPVNSWISNRWADHTHIFTDGSKGATATSWAVVAPSKDLRLAGRLPSWTGIFAAEGEAIRQAFLLIKQHQWPKAIIFTDCKAWVTLLRNGWQDDRTWTLLRAFPYTSSGASLSIQWIPGHSGVTGNEEADALARAALSSPISSSFLPSRSDVKRRIHHAMEEEWDSTWKMQHAPRHLFPFKNSVRNKFLTLDTDRSIASTIYQLRTGHSDLNAFRHRIGLASSPACPHCGLPETVRHFMLHCKAYANDRAHLRQCIDGRNEDDALSLLLGEALHDPQWARRVGAFISRTKRLGA